MTWVAMTNIVILEEIKSFIDIHSMFSLPQNYVQSYLD